MSSSAEHQIPAQTGRTSSFPAPAPGAMGTPPPSLLPTVPPAFRSDIEDAERLFGLGNFSAALRAAQRHMESCPESQTAALMVRRCTAVLEGFYLEKLGRLGHVPTLAVPEPWLSKLGLDSQQAFVLGLLGHGFSYEELIEACPFERLAALRLLARFLEAGLITHERPLHG